MYVLCTTMACMCVCAQALFVWLLYVCTYVCDMSSCIRSLCVLRVVCTLHSLCVLYVFVESEIEYRPPSIIGRVYKICALLGQLPLAPKCSPKSQNLVEK